MVEIRFQRVAAGQQRCLALVEFRVGEGQIALDHRQQHIGAAMAQPCQPAIHRADIARRVEDRVVAAGGFPTHQLGARLRQHARRQRQPVGGAVAQRHLGPLDRGKDRRAQADGPCPHDQRRGSGAQPRPRHAMRADGQKFDHRRRAAIQPPRGIEVRLGDHDLFGHAAVDMHAQNRNRFTAVRRSVPAGPAEAAGQIGVHHHQIAHRDGPVGTGIQRPARQLVPHHPGIGQKRLLAAEDVVIGAADPDMADPHPHLTGRRGRTGTCHHLQLSGFCAGKGLHLGHGDLRGPSAIACLLLVLYRKRTDAVNRLARQCVRVRHGRRKGR